MDLFDANDKLVKVIGLNKTVTDADRRAKAVLVQRSEAKHEVTKINQEKAKLLCSTQR